MRTITTGILLTIATSSTVAAPPNPETLIDSPIEAISSHRAIMSRVTLPANTVLPRHFHPSEEYLYVISGATTLKIDGQPDVLLKAGMAHQIPAKAVHTAETGDTNSKVIVFRVHPKGHAVATPVKD